MTSFHDRLYYWSPVFLQDKFISAYGRKLLKQRYGGKYASAFHHYSNKSYDSLESERHLQICETKRLIAHAVDKSTFYRELYRGVDLSKINCIDDLQRLPIVEKEMLRESIESVYTIRPHEGIEAFTGGTTGKSLRVFYTIEDFQKRMAYLDAFKLRCGIDPISAKKATFSGRSFAKGAFQGWTKRFWRDNSSYNQRLYSTFDMSEENIPAYIANLNTYAPDVINGFVSAIYQIAHFASRNNLPISFRPKAIFTTSETLLGHHRDVIERVFGAKIFNQYASAEGAPFITECAEGNLHYNIDTGVIESQDFGLGSEMLVTSFTSYGTPLIRYRIGDGIVFERGECPCGHCHPLVKSIEGRKVDYLFSVERGRVSLSHLADVIKGLPNCVKEMQFVQKELDEIVIRVAADEVLFDDVSQQKIANEMIYRFGAKVRFVFERVDAIPRESSGKYSLIKNQLNNSVLEKIVAV